MNGNSYVLERALFVVGAQNSGKSVQLRSMFRDFRLGTAGEPPAQSNLPEMYRLSNERFLYLRLSSPHESWESVNKDGHENFLDKTHAKFLKETHSSKRMNLATALQPDAFRNMPDVVRTVELFVARFKPERTRVAFLSPDHSGAFLQDEQLDLAKRLRQIASVEVCWIDARDRMANGLFLADFFDFS